MRVRVCGAGVIGFHAAVRLAKAGGDASTLVRGLCVAMVCVATVARRMLESAAALSIPLVVETGTSHSWAEAH